MIALFKIEPSYLFLLGVAVLTATLLRRIRRQKRKEATAKPVRTSTRSGRDVLPSHGDQLQQYLLLEERFRELSARIDNKMIVLQKMLEQVNEQIAQMEELQKSSAEQEPPAGET